MNQVLVGRDHVTVDAGLKRSARPGRAEALGHERLLIGGQQDLLVNRVGQGHLKPGPAGLAVAAVGEGAEPQHQADLVLVDGEESRAQKREDDQKHRRLENLEAQTQRIGQRLTGGVELLLGDRQR